MDQRTAEKVAMPKRKPRRQSTLKSDIERNNFPRLCGLEFCPSPTSIFETFRKYQSHHIEVHTSRAILCQECKILIRHDRWEGHCRGMKHKLNGPMQKKEKVVGKKKNQSNRKPQKALKHIPNETLDQKSANVVYMLSSTDPNSEEENSSDEENSQPLPMERPAASGAEEEPHKLPDYVQMASKIDEFPVYYKCKFCTASKFQYGIAQVEFDKHKDCSSVKTRWYQCDKCAVGMIKGRIAFDHHMKKHSGKFKCPFFDHCGESFGIQRYLTNHLPICPALKQKQRKLNKELIDCSSCPSKWETKEAYQDHVKMCHPISKIIQKSEITISKIISLQSKDLENDSVQMELDDDVKEESQLNCEDDTIVVKSEVDLL